MTRDDKIELLAQTLYKCDYPNGGSVYRDWESLPAWDKLLYKADAHKFLLVTEGKAEIKTL